MLLTQHCQGESNIIIIGKCADPNLTDIPKACGPFSGFQSCLFYYHHLTEENRPFPCPASEPACHALQPADEALEPAINFVV